MSSALAGGFFTTSATWEVPFLGGTSPIEAEKALEATSGGLFPTVAAPGELLENADWGPHPLHSDQWDLNFWVGGHTPCPALLFHFNFSIRLTWY